MDEDSSSGFGVFFVNSVKTDDDGEAEDFGDGNDDIENDLEDFYFYFYFTFRSFRTLSFILNPKFKKCP